MKYKIEIEFNVDAEMYANNFERYLWEHIREKAPAFNVKIQRGSLNKISSECNFCKSTLLNNGLCPFCHDPFIRWIKSIDLRSRSDFIEFDDLDRPVMIEEDFEDNFSQHDADRRDQDEYYGGNHF